MEPEIHMLLAGFFLGLAMLLAAAESAVKAASRSGLEDRLEDGDQRVLAALRYKDHPEIARSVVQMSSALLLLSLGLLLAPLANIGIQVLLTSTLEPIAHGFAVAALWTVFVMVLGAVHLLFVTLFAKAIGARFAEPLAIRFSPLLRGFERILSPFRRMLLGTANLLLRPAGTKAHFMDAVMSEESLKTILEEGTKSGILDPTEHELIESIFAFTETTAREVMIPRKDVIALDIHLRPEQILELVTSQGFTRLPVYDESLDNIVGIVYSKDILSLVQHRDLIILQDILRPPFIVPETMPISELLREFQRKRNHLAVVVDEFGGTEGLITMEDILEEIVGEIQDEYDDEDRPVILLQDGLVEVIGSLNISDLNDSIPFTIPESDDYDTVGGYVTTVMGRIPRQGDTAIDGHVRITIVGVTDRRVTRVRLEHVPDTNSTSNSLH